MSSQTAVFVDGENIGADHAQRIVAAAQKLGPVCLQRVYGNVALIPGWSDVPGFRLIHSNTGPNSADLLLSIDAIEIALTLAPAHFVIASSDGDFIHLATRLKERGHTVLGVGMAKAPTTFRAACSEFHLLAPNLQVVEPPGGAKADTAGRKDSQRDCRGESAGARDANHGPEFGHAKQTWRQDFNAAGKAVVDLPVGAEASVQNGPKRPRCPCPDNTRRVRRLTSHRKRKTPAETGGRFV